MIGGKFHASTEKQKIKMKKISFILCCLLISISIFAQTDPVKFFIRGTNYNRSNSRILIIGSQTIYNTSAGRGLRLTVINKNDQAVVSDQVFDCFADATATVNLTSALNQITNLQIGILTSFDAWEGQVTTTLDAAFYRLGLVKAGATANSGSRRPYAAIFEGAAANEMSSKAVEVSYSNSVNQPYAEISGYFYNGSFVATGSQPNALLKPQGDGIGLLVDGNGYVGIGTTTPDCQLHIKGGLAIQNPTLPYDSRGDAGIRAGIMFGTNHATNNAMFWISPDATIGNRLHIGCGLNYSDNGLLTILNNGNVGIGNTNPGYRLEVNGTIRSKAIKVEVENWPDYVFADDYPLKDLSEVEQYINANNHLPDVPAAETMEQQGVNLGEMNRLLLKKVEELTLYLIQQQKEIDALKQMINPNQTK